MRDIAKREPTNIKKNAMISFKNKFKNKFGYFILMNLE